MYRKIGSLCLLIGFLFVPFSVTNAAIIPIDLNDFFADPTVTIAPDGSSATMNEDPDLITVLLSNDPGLGDPGIPVPADLLSLSFSYSFLEGQDNDDEFYAKVFDGISGLILFGFLIEDSGSGIVTWDLSGIDSAITLLGLEFQLNSWEDPLDNLFDSSVEISNVYLETAATPVPEPATMLLLGSGLAALFGLGRRKFLLFR